MEIDIFPDGSLSVATTTATGETHRRAILPGDDLTGEPPAVQAAAASAWTSEVLGAWAQMRGATEPTPEERLDVYRAAIDAHVEAQARALLYNGAAHIAGYCNSSVAEWAAEAQAFVAWRDAVWVAAIAMLDTVDPAAPPTVADVLAQLPAWPGVPE